MTTYPIAESDEMADALHELAAVLEQRRDFACRYIAGLRNSARPGSGVSQPGELPYAERAKVAQVARELAAEGGPHAERLQAFASGLDASLEQLRINGGGPRPTSWLLSRACPAGAGMPSGCLAARNA